MVTACREFIPQTAACLDDPRLELTIAEPRHHGAGALRLHDPAELAGARIHALERIEPGQIEVLWHTSYSYIFQLLIKIT